MLSDNKMLAVWLYFLTNITDIITYNYNRDAVICISINYELI